MIRDFEISECGNLISFKTSAINSLMLGGAINIAFMASLMEFIYCRFESAKKEYEKLKVDDVVITATQRAMDNAISVRDTISAKYLGADFSWSFSVSGHDRTKIQNTQAAKLIIKAISDYAHKRAYSYLHNYPDREKEKHILAEISDEFII